MNCAIVTAHDVIGYQVESLSEMRKDLHWMNAAALVYNIYEETHTIMESLPPIPMPERISYCMSDLHSPCLIGQGPCISADGEQLFSGAGSSVLNY